MGKSTLQKLKDDEREMRRKLIISTAKTLFKTMPFHKIGMRTIASELNISVATIYQNFPSQDDLFLEILKNDFQFVKKELWPSNVSLEEISINIVDFFLDNEDIFTMMGHFMIRGEKNLETLEKFNKEQDFFLELLYAAIIKHNPELNNVSYARAFFTALFGNILTFRTTVSDDSTCRENLYETVKITAKAFQDSFTPKAKLKKSA